MTLPLAQCKELEAIGLKPPKNPAGAWFWVEGDGPFLCLGEDAPGGWHFWGNIIPGSTRSEDEEVFIALANTCTYHPDLERVIAFVSSMKPDAEFTLWHQTNWTATLIWCQGDNPPKAETEAGDTPLLAAYALAIKIGGKK